MSTVIDRLHSQRLRATPQRVLLLQILDSGEHMDAESVYHKARQLDPNISLATVYRTLDRLKKSGLLSQRYFSRQHKREYYETGNKQEHYHFKCLGCGQVIEVQTPRIAQMRREVAEQLGLVFQHACICLEGYCASCAARKMLKSPRSPDSQGKISLKEIVKS